MSASAIPSAATLVALFDNAEAAGRASGAVEARIPGATVHRIDPTGATAWPQVAWLPTETIDPYLASLGEGQTLVMVQTTQPDVSAVDGILREFEPADVTIHGADQAIQEDDALPPSVQSTAAQNPRPRGHRDPSA
jgi:hypothetical protein